MRTFLLLISLGSLSQSQAFMPIYGDDNRKNLSEVKDPIHLKLAESVAMMVNRSSIEGNRVVGSPLYKSSKVCYQERFSFEDSPGRCTGFLVAPDLLMTAGHCMIYDVSAFKLREYRRQQRRPPVGIPLDPLNPEVDEAPVVRAPVQEIVMDTREYMDAAAKRNCQDFSWVFDYNDREQFLMTSDSIYSCAEVLESHWHEDTTLDYALIRLDRPVRKNGTARTPLKLNLNPNYRIGQELDLIGHPMGLSTKVTDGGKVLGLVGKEVLRPQADLSGVELRREKENDNRVLRVMMDSFGGNSGSPVFDHKTHDVVGILTMGHGDVRFSSQPTFGSKVEECMAVRQCTEAQMLANEPSCNGEIVFKLNQLPRSVQSRLKK